MNHRPLTSDIPSSGPKPGEIELTGAPRRSRSPGGGTPSPSLLVLRTLLPGRAHGHAIAKSIERSSSDVLQVEQGSLYPALHRLIKRGWIVAEDGTSENNRRAKFYRLTAKGKKQLTVETGKWERLASAIARILRPETEPTG